MTLFQLALRNVRGGWRRYSAFVLSSIFSVTVFFIYTAVIYHPDIVHGNFLFASGVRNAMSVCLVLIAVFSFFFSLYSFSAFVRSREKEFGLLTLLGMTRGQLRLLVLGENVLLSVLTIAAGIGLGALLSKLFIMALLDLLGMPSIITYAIPAKAVAVTAISFFALFFSIAMLTLYRVGRTEIVDLLKAASKAPPMPRFSWLLAGLSFICLGSGYYLAATSTVATVGARFFPVIGIVTVGTYLLLTQGSVAVLTRLQKYRHFSHRGTNLVTLSQFVFRIRNNARVLFVVSIMSAVVLTAAGTAYVFAQTFTGEMKNSWPQAFGWTVKGQQSELLDVSEVDRMLAEAGIDVSYAIHETGLELPTPESDLDRVLALPVSVYNRLATLAGRETVTDLRSGSAVLITPFVVHMERIVPGQQLTSPIGGNGSGGETASASFSVTLVRQLNGAVTLPLPDTLYLLVIDDADYTQLTALLPPDQFVTFHTYEVADWIAAEPVVTSIAAQIPDDGQHRFVEFVSRFVIVSRAADLTLFLGAFMCVLFFLATGSMLYFKLYTELQDDQAQFRALARIGISPDEIQRIVTRQTAILFYLPCLIAIAHAAFAMQALGNSLQVAVWQHAGIVLAVWLVLQTGYFLAARATYVRSLLGAAGPAAA